MSQCYLVLTDSGGIQEEQVISIILKRQLVKELNRHPAKYARKNIKAGGNRVKRGFF
jgi:UDP-N-acetylglucosamine 2-epimerase